MFIPTFAKNLVPQLFKKGKTEATASGTEHIENSRDSNTAGASPSSTGPFNTDAIKQDSKSSRHKLFGWKKEKKKKGADNTAKMPIRLGIADDPDYMKKMAMLRWPDKEKSSNVEADTYLTGSGNTHVGETFVFQPAEATNGEGDSGVALQDLSQEFAGAITQNKTGDTGEIEEVMPSLATGSVFPSQQNLTQNPGMGVIDPNSKEIRQDQLEKLSASFQRFLDKYLPDQSQDQGIPNQHVLNNGRGEEPADPQLMDRFLTGLYPKLN